MGEKVAEKSFSKVRDSVSKWIYRERPMARATSSLPDPVGPMIKVVKSPMRL
jgi:hypothetical protein